MVSGVHARIESSASGFVIVHVSQTNKTFINGSTVEGSAPVRAGDRVRLGLTGPTVEILAIEPVGSSVAVAPNRGLTVQADYRQMALLRGTAGAMRFVVGAGGVIGRDARAVQFHLDHPHVSRLHASLAADRGQLFLADLGSANGTFLNGRRLMRPVELAPGDRIDIGPFSLRFDGLALVSTSRSNNIQLAACGLKRVVQDRTTGQPLVLLEHINLVVRPREFVCILGPSGSGKSTLLAILSGRNAPDAGFVFLNDADLFSNFEALKEDIAVVPQKEALHDSLAVGAALRFTAELRLPPDLSRAEIDGSVRDILEVVGLSARHGTLVRHLSGGQVKRVSLANELVARPSLLFLDEVTSGLDEQTDREVMELFRQVADGGKTVVCITHSLANVEATCHLVVILTEGGRLAFIGTPDEAKTYFGITRLGDVYWNLATRDRQEWHARFRASSYFQRYVVERMPSNVTDEGKKATPPQPIRRGASGLRQATVLIRRYLSIWRGDSHALLVMFGQSLLIALLLGSVFGSLGDVINPAGRALRTANLLLLLAVSCYWFGCNTAAKELVKERVIFLRERDFNLRVSSYFLSKFLVLALITFLQATLLFFIVRPWCQPPGFSVLQWLTLDALAVAGTAAGLLISALARTEEVATALVPIAVIPQIILAGVVAPLNGLVQLLAEGFISVYWARQALESLLSDGDLELLQRQNDGFSIPCAIVFVQAMLAVAATVVILWKTKGKAGLR
jgi:ABC-type multidrug transport system ATPase subunit/pSer/pThr/pTyr-binding forkhead associated (FHA) protein